jgi:hypothetical protein
MISSGYNDYQNTLIAPYPKVRINAVSQELVHIWGYRQSSFIDNAAFDGTSVATGVPASRQPAGRMIIRLSPNPVTDVFSVRPPFGYWIRPGTLWSFGIFASRQGRTVSQSAQTG